MRTDASSFKLPLSNAEEDAYEFLSNDVMLRDDVLDDVTDDDYIFLTNQLKAAKKIVSRRLANALQHHELRPDMTYCTGVERM